MGALVFTFAYPGVIPLIPLHLCTYTSHWISYLRVDTMKSVHLELRSVLDTLCYGVLCPNIYGQMYGPFQHSFFERRVDVTSLMLMV